MDKIILNRMAFFAHHGVSEAERETGQRFEVDVELFVDLTPGAKSDDIEDTLDYHMIYGQISEVMTSNRFCLLERLAEALAARILSNQLVEKVILRVKKIQPPIAGQIESVAVEIGRER